MEPIYVALAIIVTVCLVLLLTKCPTASAQTNKSVLKDTIYNPYYTTRVIDITTTDYIDAYQGHILLNVYDDNGDLPVLMSGQPLELPVWLSAQSQLPLHLIPTRPVSNIKLLVAVVNSHYLKMMPNNIGGSAKGYFGL